MSQCLGQEELGRRIQARHRAQSKSPVSLESSLGHMLPPLVASDLDLRALKVDKERQYYRIRSQ